MRIFSCVFPKDYLHFCLDLKLRNGSTPLKITDFSVISNFTKLDYHRFYPNPSNVLVSLRFSKWYLDLKKACLEEISIEFLMLFQLCRKEEIFWKLLPKNAGGVLFLFLIYCVKKKRNC